MGKYWQDRLELKLNEMRNKIPIFLIFSLCLLVQQLGFAQQGYWQQHVSYKITADVDVISNRIHGMQKIVYTNNSPDTLRRIFYHLYWNAMQPNSTMSIARKGINKLKKNETGYQEIKSIKLDGVFQKTIFHETVLEVILGKPIPPKSKVVLDMLYETQVPLVIYRSGRDNSPGPGVGNRYTMGQWYPKVCEYDKNGWNLSQYVGNGEFYGVWGDFDVRINIDKSYILGGTGYLQNPDQIGYGYGNPKSDVPRSNDAKLSWHFKANNVHDFMWSADPGYSHVKRELLNGVTIHVLYKADTSFIRSKRKKEGDALNQAIAEEHLNWNKLADAAAIVLPFLEQNFGAYPYKQYTFIHGGFAMGGMEYPMSSSLSDSNISTAIHELIHSWYPMLMANNESKSAWMDEGFTSYATNLAMDYYRSFIGVNSNRLVGLPIQQPSYLRYFEVAKSPDEEPLTTHADHFDTYLGYACGSYGKGAVFLEQLGYVVGASVRDKILLEYYRLWKFKHPDANDFIRVAENVSGMKLDWYQEYFINTIKTIDYGIDSVWDESGKTKVRLQRTGKMPMPIDLVVKRKDGTCKLFYIPMSLMYGLKPKEDPKMPIVTMPEWKFNAKTYELEIGMPLSSLSEMEIDPTQRMADINRGDNKKTFN